MRYLFAVLVLVLMSHLASAAGVNKCISPDGKVLFTQGACPAGQAGEVVKIKPVNGMNNSANERVGPRADKYVEPLDLTGDYQQQLRRIKAVVDIGVIKARDCDWALKVEKTTYKCMDLLAYMIEGSVYSQAMERAASFTTEEVDMAPSELRSIIRSAGEMNQAKELMQTYLRTP